MTNERLAWRGRMPFQRLMELVAALDDRIVTVGELSQRWNESALRIEDAIDACRVLAGEQTYFSGGGG